MAERDPLVGFKYKIDVQPAIQGYFTECSGLGSESDVIEHKIVDDQGNEETRKIPGRLKWGDIKLKRGITDKFDMWDWRRQVEVGDMNTARKNGSIVMYDQQGKMVAQWDFKFGWPSKISGPDLKADSNAYGVEELTIVHEGLERVM